MKVLVLTNIYPPDFLGGYELACLQAADGLAARGHDVRVVTAAPRRPVPCDPPHVRRRFALADEWSPGAMGALPVTHLVTHAEARFVSSHNVHTLLAELAEFRPDVVYLHSLVGLGGLGLLACLARLDVPWVWQLGDCLPKLLCSSRLRRVIPALAGEYSRRVVGDYIAVSGRVRDEIEAAGIALNGRVEVIPNWVTGERPPARSSYYQGGHLRIISAGQVSRDKGVDLLIEAAGLLRDWGVGAFSVDIYGHADDPFFTDLVGRLGLESRVSFRGVRPHDEITRLYQEYDLLAFPTWVREPFGLVALEAASRGCVPLISRECGAAEWLVHGAHCLKAERTAGSFAAAVRAVADGRVGLGPIARRGAEAAWRDFHLDAVLPKIERALERAAREGRGRRPRPGAAAEAYRLAKLAEQLAESLIQEHVLTYA